MWRTKPPDPEKIELLNRQREEHDLYPLVIHDSYLINLAAPPSIIREKSIEGFRGELERALLIGADYLVAHPGNYKGLTVEQGILNVAEGIGACLAGSGRLLKEEGESSRFCSKIPPERARNSVGILRSWRQSANLSALTWTFRSDFASIHATAM